MVKMENLNMQEIRSLMTNPLNHLRNLKNNILKESILMNLLILVKIKKKIT